MAVFKRCFLYTAVLFMSAAPSFHAYAAAVGPVPSDLTPEEAAANYSSYEPGSLTGTTFSNSWADYTITFPDTAYFDPDSLISYMSMYTGLDYEFAASLYGDTTVYPCINISFQKAFVPLKECTENLLDVYGTKDFDCEVKSGVWVGPHPFTRVRARSKSEDICIDNYLRLVEDQLMWICAKYPGDDPEARKAVQNVLNSVTAFPSSNTPQAQS